jgi:beta-lactamase regulating signal transducer with metallopeptidase domain
MSAFAEAIRPATDACWTSLFHASWQAAIVGLLILAVVAIGRRMSAPLRYGLLIVALVKFVLPPFAAMPFGVMSRFSPPIGATSTVDPLERPTSGINLPAESMSDDRSNAAAPAQNPSNSKLIAKQSPILIATLPIATRPVVAANPLHSAPHSEAPPAAAPISTMESEARPPAFAVSADPQLVKAAARGWDFSQVAVLTWVAGLCLVIAWLFHQGWRLRRILRASTRVETAGWQARMLFWATRLGLRRVPELRQAKFGTVPFSCGLFAPKVVVPATLFEQLSPDQMDVVLSHELAHHRRRDPWVNVLQLAVFVVFWFHPVVWILNRAIRRIREDCCDDLLLANSLITPEICCETLLAVARAQAAQPSLVWGVSMGHPLGTRLSRLMDESQVRRFRLSRGGWLCLLACGALLWPGLRVTAAVQNGNDSVRPTANAPQANPQSQNANAGAANPQSAPATKSRTPAAVEYTTFATRLDGRRFDKVTRAKLVDANGRPFDLYRAAVSFGSVQTDDPDKSTFVKWQIDIVESTFFPWMRDLVAPRRLIAVTAAGYGPAFCDLTEGVRLENRRAFHLPKDDVPIRGRIVSVRGEPIAGVRVTPRILQYFEAPDGKPVSLDAAAPIVEADVRSRHVTHSGPEIAALLVRSRHVTRSGPEIAALLPSATTDSAGRFEIRGIGRERVVRLLISGPGIASLWISVATRSTAVEYQDLRSKRRLFAIYWPESNHNPSSASLGFGMILMGDPAWSDEVLPAGFVQAVAPSRPIVGVVRDDRSGQPLANVRVSNEPPSPGRFMNWTPKRRQPAEPRGEVRVVATTNERGEFQLNGVSQRRNVILAEPPESLPYFNRGMLCETRGDGVEPIKLVIQLARGIPVSGRLLDQNGKPMAGRISYFPVGNNAIVGAYLDSVSVGRTGGALEPQFPETQADANGRFWIPVLPGPGVLLADRREVGTRSVRFVRPEDAYANVYAILHEDDPTVVPTSPRPLSLNPYDAYKGIDLPADVGSVQVDLQVNVGHAVEGRVVDPSGKPLAGVLAYGTTHDRLAPDGKFETRGLVPGRPRLLYFLQPEKGLGGSCRVEDGEPGPITVGLEPTGTIRGFLADANGKPLAHARFYLAYAEADSVPRVIFPGGWRIPTADEYDRARWLGVAAPPVDHRWESTDENGAFLVRGVIPDLAFQLFASTGQYKTDALAVTRVRPNRFLDLGTLKLPVVQ